MENGDDWVAMDKLEHVLFCFFISIVTSLMAARTRYAFIRRRRILVGSIASFSAGAAKEFADELGYFKSAGASNKDVVADLIGILLAALLLRYCLSNSNSYESSTSSRGKIDIQCQTQKVLDMV